MKLKPFFTYYGGKWRAAPRYPAPRHSTVIEPFAGAAGYSLRYADRDVLLIEKNAKLAALWRYLISVSADRIRGLPLICSDGSQTVSDLGISPEEETLVGFWLNKGTASPCKRPSAWMREGLRPKSFWGPEIRDRIASQVAYIRHWRVLEGEYHDAPDVEATWFVDPPYEAAGKLYSNSSRDIEYFDLGCWCYGLRGQVVVCENEGATWLPFKPFITIKSTEGRHGKSQSREAIWLNE